MRDLSELMGDAFDARARSLGGLSPDGGVAGLRSRVRRRRVVRHTVQAVAALPVVAALAVGVWYLGGEHEPEPVATPEPSVSPEPSPTPSPTPKETEEPELVLGDPIDEPGVPTYYAMPDGLLDHVGAGWVLATYAPRVYVEGFPPPPFELIFLVDPAGTRFLVARLDPGGASDGAAETWVEHSLVSWQAGELTATLREIRYRAEGGNEPYELGAPLVLSLATGALSPVDVDDETPTPGLSPDGTMVLSTTEGGAVIESASDGRRIAALPSSSPAGWCHAVNWWTSDSILATCLDEDPDADDGDGIVSSRNPRLVVVTLDELGSGAGAVVRRLVVGDPLPAGGTYVADGVVAWQGTEISAQYPHWSSCPTGVYLQTGDRIERLPASSDPRVELNIFAARAADGVVYVDATGGCSGDARPRILTSYDVGTGVTTELVGPPPEVVNSDQWLQGLTSYVIGG